MQSPPIRIGTRGSPLALAQAAIVADGLRRAHGLGDDAIEIVKVRTTGDAVQNRRLAEIGGKGLFTKEIEQALIDGAIHLAVHSMKDVETALPDGLEIAAILKREDPRDALIAVGGARAIAELPRGAIVGTASLRRAALTRVARPDIEIVPLRGNVQTRLARLAPGAIDATFLAMAGLNRLGLAPPGMVPVAPDDMLPAVAQGAIGIEIRAADPATRALVAPLDDTVSGLAVAAERAFLAGLDGSCRTPIAALAELAHSRLRLRGLIARPDGSAVHRVELSGLPTEAGRLGAEAAAELKGRAGPGFLSG